MRGERYEVFGKNGVACVANDRRGHGNSVRNEEDRGDTYQGGAKAFVYLFVVSLKL